MKNRLLLAIALFFGIVNATDYECNLYPLTVSQTLLNNAHIGQFFERVPFGKGPAKSSWLTWDGRNNTSSLNESLVPPGNSEIYINPDNSADHTLSSYDWVDRRTGVRKNSSVEHRLDNLLGHIITIPVWQEKRGQNGNIDYQIASFAKVKLTNYRLKGNNGGHGYNGNGSGSGKGWLSFVYKGSADCGYNGNASPVAEDLSVQGPQDYVLSINLTASDGDGDPLAYSTSSSPENGTLAGDGPTLEYTPNPGFIGEDSFTYIANDGSADSNLAHVAITILSDDQQECELYPLTVSSHLVYQAHIGKLFERVPFGKNYGNASWLTWDGTNSVMSLVESLIPPGNSNHYINPDNSNDYTISMHDWVTRRTAVRKNNSIEHRLDNLLGQEIIIPVWQDKRGQYGHIDYKVATFVKVKLINYRLSSNGSGHTYGDGGGNNKGWVSFVYKGLANCDENGNTPPVAENLSVQGPQNEILNLTVIATDIDDNDLTYTINSPPQNGTLTGDGPSFVYTPNAGFFGLDSFTYTANDGTTSSNQGHVEISILNTGEHECELYPLTISKVLIHHAQIGQYFQRIPLGVGYGNYSWLTWDGLNDAVSLAQSLVPPGNSEIYINPDDPSDNLLSINDWVQGRPGVKRSQAIRQNLDNLLGQVITIPVWQDKRYQGSNFDYKIASFAKIKLIDYRLKGNGNNGGYGNGGGDCGGHGYGGGSCGGKGWISFIYKGPGSCDNENIPPVAENLNAQGPQDEPVNLTVNATDADNDELTYRLLSLPTNGLVSGDGPDYVYTPNLGFFGIDSFTFVANDGSSDSNEAIVSIAILEGENSPPVADDLIVDVIQDTESMILVSASDPDLDPLTYRVVTPPENGLLIGDGPNYTYVPNPGFVGTDTFSFVANDGAVDSNIAEATINVLELNSPPVAEDIFVTGVKNEELPLQVIAIDTDGDPLTYDIVDFPVNGLVIGTGPDYTYVPDPDFVGDDTFTFMASDGDLDSNIATVTITIEDVNSPPVADNLLVDVLQDTASEILVSASDPDDDPLTYRIVTQPENGTISGDGPDFIYTPNPGFTGTDTFSFVANDGTVDSNEAAATVNVLAVNSPPVAENVTVTGTQDSDVPLLVIASDPDNDPLTFIIVTPPQNGTLSGSGPDFIYTPNPGFFGEDTFSFQATDGDLNSNVAQVSLTIEALENTAPVAINTTELTIFNESILLTLEAFDTDGDPLTYIIESLPINGSLIGTGPTLEYVPELGFIGVDVFTFKVNDGTEDSNTATVTIFVDE